MRRIGRLFATLLLGVSPIATAQSEPAEATAQAAGDWSVSKEAHRCAAVRSDGDAGRLEIEQSGSVRQVNVIYYGTSEPRRDRWDSGRLLFEPAGLTLGQNGSFRRDREAGGGYVAVYALDPASLTGLDRPQTMEIEFDGRRRASLVVEPFDEVLARLQSCHDRLLREWGVDPDHMRRLAVSPEPANNPGSWVTVQDYPASARRSGMGGRATFRLHIDAEGRVSDCAIVVSSGARILDDTVCVLLRRRAIFDPARSAEGEPVPSSYISVVGWDP